TQGSSSQIKLSQARSIRARRDHVPNRNCHRSNFRTYKETPLLDRELGFRSRRLRLSFPRRDRKVGGDQLGSFRELTSKASRSVLFCELRSVIPVEKGRRPVLPRR